MTDKELDDALCAHKANEQRARDAALDRLYAVLTEPNAAERSSRPTRTWKWIPSRYRTPIRRVDPPKQEGE